MPSCRIALANIRFPDDPETSVVLAVSADIDTEEATGLLAARYKSAAAG